MMNLNNATTDHLSDVDLDWVSGGMDCKTAIAVSQAYAAAAGVMVRDRRYFAKHYLLPYCIGRPERTCPS